MGKPERVSAGVRSYSAPYLAPRKSREENVEWENTQAWQESGWVTETELWAVLQLLPTVDQEEVKANTHTHTHHLLP